ncbi:protein kinase domain protein, partial [Ichthyophthirius multifiliis]
KKKIFNNELNLKIYKLKYMNNNYLYSSNNQHQQSYLYNYFLKQQNIQRQKPSVSPIQNKRQNQNNQESQPSSKPRINNFFFLNNQQTIKSSLNSHKQSQQYQEFNTKILNNNSNLIDLNLNKSNQQQHNVKIDNLSNNNSFISINQQQQEPKQKPFSFINYALLQDVQTKENSFQKIKNLINQSRNNSIISQNKDQLLNSNVKDLQNHMKQSFQNKQTIKQHYQPFNQNDFTSNVEELQQQNNNYQIQKSNFNLYFIIGKGGFGKVWKVDNKKTRKMYAMKEMSKALIITKKSINSVLNEKKLLSQLNHPFLVNMHYSFQDRDNLYLIMDFMEGGDLRYHIAKQKRFTEEQTKFFVVNILLGLEYLHKRNIIHRDIKPENLVLDNQGYVKITDLGIARDWNPDNQNDTSGTPGYMAPEVMCRQNHTFAVDYFALGVIAFEFMQGRVFIIYTFILFKIKYRDLIQEDQDKKQKIKFQRRKYKQNKVKFQTDGLQKLRILQIKLFFFCLFYWKKNQQMIERKPAQRLGINGPEEVKNHPWIKNFPWKQLYKKELLAPFKPSQKDNFDFKQQISVEDEQEQQLIQQNTILLRKPEVQSLFEEYDLDNTQNILKKDIYNYDQLYYFIMTPSTGHFQWIFFEIINF